MVKPNKKNNKPTTSKSSSSSSSPRTNSSNILCKSMIVILVLLFIPLFPSQAPDFIKETIFPELWELLHLMFFGIAVCYGLFSRRSENKIPRFDPNNDAYLSGISNVSSIFDNVYGSCEKIGLDESGESFDNFKVSQTWNSQYYLGESKVVVANRDQMVINPITHFDNRPLGLPVRRLKSRIAYSDDDGGGGGGEVEKNRTFSSSDCSSMGKNVVMMSGIVHENSEKGFDVPDEANLNLERSISRRRRDFGGEELCRVKPTTPQYSRSHSASEFEFGGFRPKQCQQPPSSRSSSKGSSPCREQQQSQLPNSDRKEDLEELPVSVSEHGEVSESSIGSLSEANMEMEDELGEASDAKTRSHSKLRSIEESDHHSHSKLRSIEESDHDHRRVKSWSFWHQAPSEINSRSSSPTGSSPISSPSPKQPNVETYEYVEENDAKASSDSVNGEAKFVTSRNQWSEMNGKDSSHKGKRTGYLESRVKPSSRPKVLSRGKSVRTIRPSRVVADDLKPIRPKRNPLEALSSVRVINGVNEDSTFPPKQNGREESFAIGDNLESREDDSVSLLNNGGVSSDEEKPGSCIVDDVELGSEVDRKADEFIAKFRQQIRLQKIESFRRN